VVFGDNLGFWGFGKLSAWDTASTPKPLIADSLQAVFSTDGHHCMVSEGTYEGAVFGYTIRDPTVVVKVIPEKKEVARISPAWYEFGIEPLAFSPDGNWVAVVSSVSPRANLFQLVFAYVSRLRLVNIENGTEQASIIVDGTNTSVCFVRNATMLAVSSGGEIRCYTLPIRKPWLRIGAWCGLVGLVLVGVKLAWKRRILRRKRTSPTS
jgi:hypothetical protein